MNDVKPSATATTSTMTVRDDDEETPTTVTVRDDDGATPSTAPVDVLVFDMMKQWVQHPEKQFVFGLLENGAVDLIIPEDSSGVSSVFREIAFGASNSSDVQQHPSNSSVSLGDISTHVVAGMLLLYSLETCHL